jgi:hypothetical protein
MLLNLLACTALEASPLNHRAVEAQLVKPVPCTVDPADLGGSQVTISDDGRTRSIRGNGIPDHDVGPFPNRGNPHEIEAQRVDYQVPVSPSGPGRDARGMEFGVSVHGVKLDPGTAEAWNNDRGSGWNYEAIGGAMNLGVDCNYAHVQPSGAYHYHGVPTGLDSGVSERIGWAADGNPIVIDRSATPSYRLRSGQRPGGSEPSGTYDGTFTQDYTFVEGLGELDRCNGREGPEGYEYVLTDAFPFVPRCFVNTPDDSFEKRGGPGGPGGPPGGGPGHRPPPPRR